MRKRNLTSMQSKRKETRTYLIILYSLYSMKLESSGDCEEFDRNITVISMASTQIQVKRKEIQRILSYHSVMGVGLSKFHLFKFKFKRMLHRSTRCPAGRVRK